MQDFEWKWRSRDGLEMNAYVWVPSGNPRAVVCLLHGHGEHIHRYDHVGQAFAAAGYLLTGFDLRGHGRSGGPRGHIPSYENLHNDVSDFLADAKRHSPSDVPVFLYGHSMGGNLALNYVLRSPGGLKGLIVTDPWLRLASEPPAFRLLLARLMNKLFPAYTEASGLEQAALSRDSEVVRAYADDPLTHDKISARLFSVMYANGLWALEHAADLKIPTLLMHGSADRLTSYKASQEFAATAGKLVTLRIWDGFYHEVHNEPEKAEVIQTMVDWIGQHL